MTATDQTIASIGLPKHPSPHDIAQALRDAAKALDTSGQQAITMAAVLAARGYSVATLGDGGSRGSDQTSSTERAVPAVTELGDTRWHLADHYYAQLLRTAWRTAGKIEAHTHELLRHADDQDPTPAGTGECSACARFCRPTKARPSFRLRTGLCPSCFGAWKTYQSSGGPMLWSEWTSKRREELTERDASGNVVAVHTPEDDGQSP